MNCKNRSKLCLLKKQTFELRLDSQKFLDVFREVFVDFFVTRYRLLLSGGGIYVNVMVSAMPVQCATLLFELSNQLASFHKAISFV